MRYKKKYTSKITFAIKISFNVFFLKFHRIFDTIKSAPSFTSEK